MTSWWLGPQLASAMAGKTKQNGLHAPSQAACAAQLECPGEITIGGLRPCQSCCPSPSGASSMDGAARGKHMALPKVVQSYRLSVVPSRLLVPRLQPLRPPGPNRGLGRSFEPQILKLPWADKELAVFRHDCTLLSLLVSCLTFSSPDTAGSPCWRAGKVRFCGQTPPFFGHPHAALCQPWAAQHELCWEAGRPWGGTGGKADKRDTQGKFRRSLLNSRFTCV